MTNNPSVSYSGLQVDNPDPLRGWQCCECVLEVLQSGCTNREDPREGEHHMTDTITAPVPAPVAAPVHAFTAVSIPIVTRTRGESAKVDNPFTEVLRGMVRTMGEDKANRSALSFEVAGNALSVGKGSNPALRTVRRQLREAGTLLGVTVSFSVDYDKEKGAAYVATSRVTFYPRPKITRTRTDSPAIASV